MTEYTGNYINDDGDYYCPKCKNIILLPNAATPLCNTCFKGQYRKPFKDENEEDAIIKWTCPNCTYNNYSGEKCVECGYLKIEQTNNQTKSIIGINKDAFGIGKWYKIISQNGDITIAMLSAIKSMHIELNCLVYVKEDDCLVSRKIEMHHCNVDAKDLKSGIVKVELLENQG